MSKIYSYSIRGYKNRRAKDVALAASPAVDGSGSAAQIAALIEAQASTTQSTIDLPYVETYLVYGTLTHGPSLEGVFVGFGSQGGKPSYKIATKEWYLWFNGITWTVSTVVGTNGTYYWTSVSSTITSAYTPHGTGAGTLVLENQRQQGIDSVDTALAGWERGRENSVVSSRAVTYGANAQLVLDNATIASTARKTIKVTVTIVDHDPSVDVGSYYIGGVTTGTDADIYFHHSSSAWCIWRSGSFWVISVGVGLGIGAGDVWWKNTTGDLIGLGTYTKQGIADVDATVVGAFA